MRPVDVVRRLCPHAKSSYVLAFENGDALFKQYGITTPIRLAHFLAQAFHETGGLTIAEENGNYRAERIREIFGWNPAKQKWNHSAQITDAESINLAGNGPALFERVYGLGNPRKHDLGNTQPGDGWKYRGRGIMQTTGRDNYRRMGEKCGVNFEAKPDLVLSAEHALKPALAEWTEGNLNAAADRDDIVAITKKINGGLNGLEDRKHWLARLKPLIDRVELKDELPRAPSPPVAPAPSKAKTIAKNATAGTIVVAGGAAAKNAHDAGVSPVRVAVIVIAAVVIAAAIYFFMHRKKD